MDTQENSPKSHPHRKAKPSTPTTSPQPELNLANPNHPTYLSGTGFDFFQQLRSLKAAGAHWSSISTPTPGEYSCTLYWD
jgi:hypothetical protein